jgi:AcrR family transcriptional regulator
MKRKTAREILAESFRELAVSKPVDKITVPNIIENCGYSKTTFYRLFRDKYDLMAWDYAQKIHAIVMQTEKEVYEWKQILWDVAELFNEQRVYLRNILLHTSGYESFSRYMKQIHIEYMFKCVLDASGLRELDIKTEMYVRTYCQGTVDLSCDWILGAYQMTHRDLAQIFEDCLPVPLQKYLVQ